MDIVVIPNFVGQVSRGNIVSNFMHHCKAMYSSTLFQFSKRGADVIIGSAPSIKKLKDLELPPIILDNKPVERKTTVKNPRVLMDKTFTWTPQVNKMIPTAYFKLKFSYRFKNFSLKNLELLFRKAMF